VAPPPPLNPQGSSLLAGDYALPRERLQYLRGQEDVYDRAANGDLTLTSAAIETEAESANAELENVRELLSKTPGDGADSAARAARAQLERCRGTLYLMAHLRLVAGDAPLPAPPSRRKSMSRASLTTRSGRLSTGVKRVSGREGLLERYQSSFDHQAPPGPVSKIRLVLRIMYLSTSARAPPRVNPNVF